MSSQKSSIDAVLEMDLTTVPIETLKLLQQKIAEALETQRKKQIQDLLSEVKAKISPEDIENFAKELTGSAPRSKNTSTSKSSGALDKDQKDGLDAFTKEWLSQNKHTLDASTSSETLKEWAKSLRNDWNALGTEDKSGYHNTLKDVSFESSKTFSACLKRLK